MCDFADAITRLHKHDDDDDNNSNVDYTMTSKASLNEAEAADDNNRCMRTGGSVVPIAVAGWAFVCVCVCVANPRSRRCVSAVVGIWSPCWTTQQTKKNVRSCGVEVMEAGRTTVSSVLFWKADFCTALHAD